MTTRLGKCCSAVHSVYCASCVGVCKCVRVLLSFFFVLRYGVWDLIVLIPDHYLSFYFAMSLTNGRGLAYTVFPEPMAPYVCYHGN